MKIVATACALEQDPDLRNFQFTCTGSMKLPDHSVVKCHGVHGSIGLSDANTSHLLSEVWKDAVNSHYHSGSNHMDSSITHAKSGTAQLGDGTHNRFMMGVMEEAHVAFFIAVEKITPNNNLPAQIANILANILK